MAILLPDDVRERIAAAVAPLRERLDGIRWVRTGQLHLTLRFIGEVPRERVVGIGDALERELAPLPAPALELGAGGAFPSTSRPSVLWVGVETDERLSDVYEATQSALAGAGIERERRAFHPHITVGRVRRGKGSRAVGDAIAGVRLEASTRVAEVSLMESVLGRSGARHTRLRACELDEA